MQYAYYDQIERNRIPYVFHSILWHLYILYFVHKNNDIIIPYTYIQENEKRRCVHAFVSRLRARGNRWNDIILQILLIKIIFKWKQKCASICVNLHRFARFLCFFLFMEMIKFAFPFENIKFCWRNLNIVEQQMRKKGREREIHICSQPSAIPI